MLRLKQNLTMISTQLHDTIPGAWFFQTIDRDKYIYFLCYRTDHRNAFCLRYTHEGILAGNLYISGEIYVVGVDLSHVWETSSHRNLSPFFHRQLEEYALILQGQQKARELLAQDTSHIEAAHKSQYGFSIAHDQVAGLYFYHLMFEKFLFFYDGEFKEVDQPADVQWHPAQSTLWNIRLLTFFGEVTLNCHGVRILIPCNDAKFDKVARNIRPGEIWNHDTIDRILADPKSL